MAISGKKKLKSSRSSGFGTLFSQKSFEWVVLDILKQSGEIFTEKKLLMDLLCKKGLNLADLEIIKNLQISIY